MTDAFTALDLSVITGSQFSNFPTLCTGHLLDRNQDSRLYMYLSTTSLMASFLRHPQQASTRNETF